MQKLFSFTLNLLFGIAVIPLDSVSAEKPADTEYWNSIYSSNRVVEIHISLSRDAWDEMQPVQSEERSNGGAPRIDFGNQYSYARADISIDGRGFKAAGLRFKGNSSYRFSSNDWKRPLKIDLNRFVRGRKLQGRTKLNLSNAFLDPAFMKEKLAYDIYRAAGLATPGVGWANITLTVEGLVEKKKLGVYVLIEQVDERFIESNLGEASKDSLLMKPEQVDDWEYLGENPEAYERYDIKLGEKNTDQIGRFAELLRIIEQAPDDEFEREIAQRMDLDQFAAYLAATSLLANIDSYIGMPHNYYLLMDRRDGKLRMLPWDLNEAFGTFLFVGVPIERAAERLTNWSIDRPWVSDRRLLERLFKTESFPRMYRATLERLLRDEFTRDKLFARVADYERAVAPFMSDEAEGSGLEEFRMGIEGDKSGMNKAVRRPILAIKPFIEKRIESVQAQLAGENSGEVFSRSK